MQCCSLKYSEFGNSSSVSSAMSLCSDVTLSAMFAVDWYLPNWRAEEIKTNSYWALARKYKPCCLMFYQLYKRRVSHSISRNLDRWCTNYLMNELTIRLPLSFLYWIAIFKVRLKWKSSFIMQPTIICSWHKGILSKTHDMSWGICYQALQIVFVLILIRFCFKIYLYCSRTKLIFDTSRCHIRFS